MLRLKGHYFAIATLLIGISFQVIFQRWPEVGASAGLYVPINRDSPWLSMQFHKNKVAYYYITLVFFYHNLLFSLVTEQIKTWLST